MRLVVAGEILLPSDFFFFFLPHTNIKNIASYKHNKFWNIYKHVPLTIKTSINSYTETKTKIEYHIKTIKTMNKEQLNGIINYCRYNYYTMDIPTETVINDIINNAAQWDCTIDDIINACNEADACQLPFNKINIERLVSVYRNHTIDINDDTYKPFTSNNIVKANEEMLNAIVNFAISRFANTIIVNDVCRAINSLIDIAREHEWNLADVLEAFKDDDCVFGKASKEFVEQIVSNYLKAKTAKEIGDAYEEAVEEASK